MSVNNIITLEQFEKATAQRKEWYKRAKALFCDQDDSHLQVQLMKNERWQNESDNTQQVCLN